MLPRDFFGKIELYIEFWCLSFNEKCQRVCVAPRLDLP